MRISVCITCWRGDIHLVERCLRQFQNQTQMPHELIVSASGVAPWKRRKFAERFQKLTPCELKFVSTWKRLPPAGARNMGVEKCEGEVIVFFDVDDLPHPEKIRFTDYIFTREDPDLFAHNYHPQAPLNLFDDADQIDFESVQTVTDLRIDTVPRSTNVLPQRPNSSGHFDMHHAHVAVKRSVLAEITYNESRKFYRREDGKFCQDVLRAGYKLLYADCKLVNYQ